MNQIRIPFWNFVRADIANLARCMLIPATPISSGLRSSHTVESHSLNILIPLSVLRFSLRFFISAVSFVMFPRLSRFRTCHNDVIDARQNNRLFPLALIWIGNVFVYHIQKGTYYVQICDQSSYQQMTF